MKRSSLRTATMAVMRTRAGVLGPAVEVVRGETYQIAAIRTCAGAYLAVWAAWAAPAVLELRVAMKAMARITDTLRRHPVVCALMTSFTLAGALGFLLYLREDWSPGRRLFTGAFCGFGVGLIILASRMLGEQGEEP